MHDFIHLVWKNLNDVLPDQVCMNFFASKRHAAEAASKRKD